MEKKSWFCKWTKWHSHLVISRGNERLTTFIESKVIFNNISSLSLETCFLCYNLLSVARSFLSFIFMKISDILIQIPDNWSVSLLAYKNCKNLIIVSSIKFTQFRMLKIS